MDFWSSGEEAGSSRHSNGASEVYQRLGIDHDSDVSDEELTRVPETDSDVDMKETDNSSESKIHPRRGFSKERTARGIKVKKPTSPFKNHSNRLSLSSRQPKPCTSQGNLPVTKPLSPREKSLKKLIAIRQEKKRKMEQRQNNNSGSEEEAETSVHSKSRQKVHRSLHMISDSDTSDDDDLINPPFRHIVPQNKKNSSGQKSSAMAARNKRPFAKSANHRKKSSISVITLSDSESDDHLFSSPDISEEEFERIIAGINGDTKDSVDNCVGVSGSAGSKRRSANLTKSPTSRRSLSKSSAEKRKRSATVTRASAGSSGNDFVPASSLINSTPKPCSPSRPCRGACSCGNNSTRSQASPGCRSPRRRTPKRPPRVNANRWQLDNEETQGAASGADESMQGVMRVVSQMEKDEEMARRLQEDLDRQYAAALASGASSTPQPHSFSGRRFPAAVARDDSEDMEMRINMLSDWEWKVHIALSQGTDIPPAPSNEFHQSPDEVLDPTLLEYLHSHPDAVNLRHSTNRRRRTTRTRGTGELAPVVLNEDSEEGQRPARPQRPQPVPRRRTRGGAAARRRGNYLPPDFGRMLGRVLMDESFEGLLDELLVRPVQIGTLNLSNDDGNDYEELLALDEQLGAVVRPKGLSAEQISRLPVTKFKKDMASADATQCHVCMCDYEDGDKLRILTCFHSFHCDCIDQWIKDNPTCPVCRIEIQV